MPAGRKGDRRRVLLQMASAAGFLAVLAVAVLIVVNGTETSGGDTKIESAGEVERLLAGIPQHGLVLGDPAAKATLVEFGDLQCPICKGYSEDQVASLIESKVRGGSARIEFRNFVILGEESQIAAAAAIAAGAQGRGWQFVELFYRNQGLEQTGYVTDDFLTAVARAAGVQDVKRWNEDRRSAATRAAVRRSTDEAHGLGFSGTPSFAVARGKGALEAIGTPATADDLVEALKPLTRGADTE